MTADATSLQINSSFPSSTKLRHNFCTVRVAESVLAAPASETYVNSFGAYRPRFRAIHRYNACARSKLPRSPSSLIAKFSVDVLNLNLAPGGFTALATTSHSSVSPLTGVSIDSIARTIRSPGRSVGFPPPPLVCP